MITKADLQAAIAECQGKKNPDASTCIKLAAFYTIKRELYGEGNEAVPAYSFAPAPERKAVIQAESGSEFADAIDGKEWEEVLPVMDELMSTLKIIQPRLYSAVMDKLT